MLQAIRDKAQGWIAWAIVILISIPFALWGIQEYLGVGSEPEVAVVNGDPITQRLLDQRTRDFRDSMRFSLGDAYDAARFDDSVLKPQVLDAMIEEKVLTDAASAWNLRTSDAQLRGFIGSTPAFQRDGRFDQQAYDAAIRNRGMSRAGFEDTVRHELTVSQLRRGVRDSVFLTEADLATRIRLSNEKRTVSYAVVPAAAYRDSVDTASDKLRAYYDGSLDQFRTPERVKLAYLVLNAATLGKLVEVDEQALRQYFEEHRSEFVAREERAMRHILVSVNAAADDAALSAAQAKAQALLDRVRAGEDFATVATAESDDPGSAANGGDLGWVERGMMVAPFEEAGFSLGKGEISDLVRTDFGFHIIQVSDVRGGSEAGFDELRDQVDAAYREFEAENLYFDYAERLADAAYENADSLAPAAEELGLSVQTTDWVTRDGGLPAALDSSKVLAAAFSDDVLGEGNNSDLVEVKAQQAVVVRIAEHEPAGVEPFDANVEMITQRYLAERSSQMAAEAGEAQMDSLRAGGKRLSDLAAANSWRLVEPRAVGRNQSGEPPAVVAAVFDVAPPQGDAKRFTGAVSADGDYLLIEIESVQGGAVDALSAAERPLVSEQLAGQAASNQMSYVSEDLRNRAEVELMPIEE